MIRSDLPFCRSPACRNTERHVPHLQVNLFAAAILFIGSEVMASPGTIPNITVTAILPEQQSAVPGAAFTLDSNQIDALRPYTLHDLMDSIPGLRTIDDDIMGRRSAIGVRGAPPRRSRKTLLLEDGVPINFSTYLDASAHYTPPTERLRDIEVLKGAGHLIHGPLNNHGIVNFRNIVALPGSAPETRIDLAAGSLNSLKQHARHSRRVGDTGIVVAYTGARADGAFDIEKTTFDDFYLSARHEVDDRQSIGASLTYYRERSDYDESNLTPAEYRIHPRTKRDRFAQEFNTISVNYLKASAQHEVQLTERLHSATQLFYTNADRPRFTVDPGDAIADALPEVVYDDPETAFVPGRQGVMVSRDRHYRTLGIDHRMAYQPAKRPDVTWEWGVRAEQHTLDDRRSVGAPGEVLNIGNRGTRSRAESYNAVAASAFLKNTIAMHGWSFEQGLRAEYYEQDLVRLSLKSDPGPHAPRAADQNALFLPSIAVLRTVNDQTTLYGNLARGYTPAPARTASGFPLRPETGINSQLGIRAELSDSLTLDAAAFYNRISDTIVQLPFSIENRNLVLNSADSVSAGLDLALSYSSDNDTGLNVFADLALNYTRARFTEDFDDVSIKDNTVPEVPEWAGSFTLGVTHDSGILLSATISHFGAFYTDPLNTRGLLLADEDRSPIQPGDLIEIREPAVIGRVPSHTLIAARASWDVPGTRANLWVQGRNLMDKLYLTDLENGMRSGAPRTLMAGFTLRF